MADGLSNPEIAGTLSASDRTIAKQVEHVLDKLGCTSRTAAATCAMPEGILRYPVGGGVPCPGARRRGMPGSLFAPQTQSPGSFAATPIAQPAMPMTGSTARLGSSGRASSASPRRRSRGGPVGGPRRRTTPAATTPSQRPRGQSTLRPRRPGAS